MLIFGYKKINIMTKGIKYGVDLINDVSGFKFDKDTISNLAKHNIPKFFITCRVLPILCNLILSTTMSY